MKKSLFVIASAVAFTAIPSLSFAEDSPLTFNAAVTSDYRYRGISQSRLKPAVSAGVDYAIPGGFYVGAWVSSIKWIKDAGELFDVNTGSTKVEVDLYGGYKGEISKDFTYDVGVLTYQYPGNKLANTANSVAIPGTPFKNANTTEVYGGVTFGPATLKYSHAVTNLFGNFDSKNSGYVDLSATFDVSGFLLTPHVGYQKVKGPYDDVATYTDYSFTVSKEVTKGLSVSLAVVGTDADKNWYVSPKGKFLGKTSGVLGVKYNF
jgi:uncharacterized protein (TIGR02001 family)